MNEEADRWDEDLEDLPSPDGQESTTVVELERETVRELRKMFRMYTWNTAFTFLSAVAGWVAITVMLWMLLNR